jgi:hypothetical protein
VIPTSDSLRTAPLVHRFGDAFNPPGLTNFLGCVQADLDVTGIRSLNFPPFATSDSISAGLYVDGRYFPSTGAPVRYVWRPDRIERSADVRGFSLRSTTFLVTGRMAAVVVLEVENTSPHSRDIDVSLAIKATVTRQDDRWQEPWPPFEDDNQIWVDKERMALGFTARKSDAASLQGTVPPADHLELNGLTFVRRLEPGERFRLSYIQALGSTLADATELFDEIAADVDGELARTKTEWGEELRSAFTPGNDRWSGSLPRLETSDDDLRRLYNAGALGVIIFKRDSPASTIGRAYDTLMPRFWQGLTFLWDYSLSSMVHALLDPGVMRTYLEHWMSTDIHSHMGTEWRTGQGVGQWYSINDSAMVRTMGDYLRWTGDREWLGRSVASVDGTEQKVADYLLEYARSWERFRTPNGLADYGGIGNLLECVSTYVHEVASMNAANVAGLRTAAAVHGTLLGDHDEASRLAGEAEALMSEVQKLYAEGKGFWHTRFPDGWLVPVRHCYDLLTLLNVMADDLSPTQKQEMVRFLERELMTPNWMHALSCADPDATFTVRPDHQWTGAYTAWPSETALGLYRIGEHERAARWMKGVAATTNQGPIGQAHFVDSVMAPEGGGARKAPPDLPYICDWACSSAGSYARMVVEGVFGVTAGFDGELRATPQLKDWDPDSRLVDLQYQGRLYTVDRHGVHEQA